MIDISSPEENVLDIKPYGLDLDIFGTYFISTEIMNKRETYISQDGKYGIWYDSNEQYWSLVIKKTWEGKRIPLCFWNPMVKVDSQTMPVKARCGTTLQYLRMMFQCLLKQVVVLRMVNHLH